MWKSRGVGGIESGYKFQNFHVTSLFPIDVSPPPPPISTKLPVHYVAGLHWKQFLQAVFTAGPCRDATQRYLNRKKADTFWIRFVAMIQKSYCPNPDDLFNLLNTKLKLEHI